MTTQQELCDLFAGAAPFLARLEEKALNRLQQGHISGKHYAAIEQARLLSDFLSTEAQICPTATVTDLLILGVPVVQGLRVAVGTNLRARERRKVVHALRQLLAAYYDHGCIIPKNPQEPVTWKLGL